MIVTEEQRKEAHAFYREALELLDESGAKFMLGGNASLKSITDKVSCLPAFRVRTIVP